MSDVCDDCGRAFGLGRHRVTTVTGREICTACEADLQGAAAGALSSPAAPVAGAISVRGWFRRLRRAKD